VSEYVSHKSILNLPRLPLEGSLDLTYRCNNSCRHCWLWLPENAPEREEELSFDEIRRIAEEARYMGCRRWNISGGEPMLRPDFAEIFAYLTSRSASYSLNTNGTLITPAIAQLLRRKGSKMVALYGATAEVYDHVSRHPGGFELTMQGFRYLKEAGAGFTVQLIPMRDNFHQWDQMVALAKSLSPHWRVGAPWLHLSACGSPGRNAQIEAQRLDPRDVVALNPPDSSYEERIKELEESEEARRPCGTAAAGDDRLFAVCIEGRRDFHIDPYGGMSFCCFIKDPALRYSLRHGSFREAWEEFIPSLGEKVRGGKEYLDNCGACESRADCKWCGVYGYLERGRPSAPVPHLCEVAREARKFKDDKDDWVRNHRRYFTIAGITVRVDSDLPFEQDTFHPKFRHFAVDEPGDDLVTLRHHFELPELNGMDLGREVYRRPPWAISRKGDTWIYRGISPEPDDPSLHRVALFNQDHTRGKIYSPDAKRFLKGGLHSLTLFPTDQILLARVLADRQGIFLHASGVVLDGQGLLFVGHSDAGKSTTVKLLNGRAEILCDDRIIVRRWPEGFKIHGNWSHGEVPEVSGSSAPLRAVLFLKQSAENSVAVVEDRREILSNLLACLIKPLATADWWEKVLPVVESLAREAPCYEMAFDKSGAIAGLLEVLVRRP
jgi:MoaA/NifB/PqqE/SkfB family radical SAM enzyme